MPEAPHLDLDAHRDAGDLVATTLVLFARHALLFLSVTLLVVAPVVILVNGVWAGGFADGGGAEVATAPAIASAVPLFLTPVLVTALHVAIVQELGAGRVPTVAQALRAAAPRFPHAIAALVVYFLLAFGGLMLLVVPGVWVFVAGYFATQAAVIQRRGPFDRLPPQLAAGRGPLVAHGGDARARMGPPDDRLLSAWAGDRGDRLRRALHRVLHAAAGAHAVALRALRHAALLLAARPEGASVRREPG